ncbi:CBS domain-containing protein [Marininema mesophilum]|uniref:CBS domain-containing protein n=1 Tax=Marininema mesophilum TaxID=1048340 RepID=A0A1H2VQG4_9BACL|nr:CBS domain-containing protein [Marininema mesophilum]SDW70563.1 CBS domain-containing protein [Marininema mesophilum]
MTTSLTPADETMMEQSVPLLLKDIIEDRLIRKGKVRCKPTDHAQVALKKMKRKGVEYLPVLKGEKLVGIVRDRDLLERMVAHPDGAKQPVNKWMKKKPPVVRLDDSPKEAIHLMEKHGTACIAVLDKGRVAGVVTLADLAAEESLTQDAGQAYHRISLKNEKKEPLFSYGMLATGVLMGVGTLLALKKSRG